MANSGRFPLFVDTSLDTHLGLDFSFDETLDALKREIVAGHLLSFPSIGEVKVQAVKLSREGTVYSLSNNMRVYTIFEGIQGTRFLYIEMETIKHERTLRNGRADEELMVPTEVPTEGMIEDLVVSEVPRVDEVLSTDPPVKPAKRERNKIRFEGSSVQEKPDNAKLMEPNISNPVEHMPTEELTSITIHSCPNEEAGGDPRVVSVKKRRHKKTKAASTGDASLMNTAGGDPGVSSKERRRKQKRNKDASTDVLPKENESSKEREINPIVEKEASKDGKKKKRTKEEAINPGAKATTHGASDEPSGTIKESVPQIDACGKKEPQTKMKKLLEENVTADQTFADVKDKSNENGDTGKVSVTSLADIPTQNAPNTHNQNKEASTEGVQTKDSAIFHTPTTEKINFIDYFLPDQPSDGIKETKGKKNLSEDGTGASVDTTVAIKTQKPSGKNETTEKPMKRLLEDMAVTSDASTKNDAEVGSQPRRRRAAVCKVASKSLAEKIDASRKSSAVVSSGAVFDDVSSKASTGDENESSYAWKRESERYGVSQVSFEG